MVAQMPYVLQLQQMTTGNSTDVTELLRKALLVATKMGLQSFRNWVNQEPHGYGVTSVPACRHVPAELKVANSYQGLTLFLINDKRTIESVCSHKLSGHTTDFENCAPVKSMHRSLFCVWRLARKRCGLGKML